MDGCDIANKVKISISVPGQGMMGATHFEEFEPERLVKSTDRVRDLGEVFTPAVIVDQMLDLLPASIWAVHPAPSFLEPSVGNGNFVSAVLSRKLTLVDQGYEKSTLPAGKSPEAAEFHALEALASVYGVDISEDNIIGGTPGHEVACRPRLLKIMHRWHSKLHNLETPVDSNFMKSAKWIVEHNMIIGNMLSRDVAGKETNRESIVLIDYIWEPVQMSVSLQRTTMADVLEAAEEAQADVLSLFGPNPPEDLWAGHAFGIHEATHNATLHLTGKKISNTRGATK